MRGYFLVALLLLVVQPSGGCSGPASETTSVATTPKRVLAWLTEHQALATSVLEDADQGRLASVREALKSHPELAYASDPSGDSLLLAVIHSVIARPEVQLRGGLAEEQTIKAILKQGAPVDIFSAAALGWVSRLSALIKGDPSLLTHRSSIGFLPLHWAAIGGSVDAVRFLIDAGAKVDDVSSGKGPVTGAATPLHEACAFGRTEVARVLLDAGADIEGKVANENGQTPLDIACWVANYDVAKLLVERGANVNAKEKASGFTLLIVATIQGNDKIVGLLIDKGADINVQDELGDQALGIAAEGGRKEIIKLLLSKGAEVNHLDGLKRNPLQIAAEHGEEEAAMILLAAGADPRVRDDHGKTATDYAKEWNLTRFLEKVKASGRGD